MNENNFPRKRPAISVVIIGKNAENFIQGCLESVHGWADEIVFVDDNSSDKTLEIVRRFTNSVFSRRMDLEGKQRNFVAAKAKNDWVMILDCDERATPELKVEIDGLFDKIKPNEIAFWIPFHNYIGDYLLRWGGCYRVPHIRLYHRKYFHWNEDVYDVVHPGMALDPGYVGGKNLTNCIVHYNYLNLEDFIRKVNRLTTLEAIKWYLDGRNMSFWRGMFRPIDRFFRRYVRKEGWKDGYYGFMTAVMHSFYELAAYSKYREVIKKGYYLKENGITAEIVAKSKRKIHPAPKENDKNI